MIMWTIFMAVSIHRGSFLCGCPYEKSPTMCGLYAGPLIFGNSS